MKTYKIINTILNTLDITDKVRLTMSAEKWGMEVSFQGSQLLVVANIAALQRIKWKMLPEVRYMVELRFHLIPANREGFPIGKPSRK